MCNYWIKSSQIGADIAWDVKPMFSEFDLVCNGVLHMTCCMSTVTKVVTKTRSEMERNAPLL